MYDRSTNSHFKWTKKWGAAHDGQYCYHPLLISLANTAEPLFLFNRSGNRPSSKLADFFLDKAGELCLEAGFRTILLRGSSGCTSAGYAK
jgi:hypothetical protein